MTQFDIDLPEVFTSKVTNCLLIRKSEDDVIFYGAEGLAIASLDGYAVIPMEEFTAMESVLDQHYPGGVAQWRLDRENPATQ